MFALLALAAACTLPVEVTNISGRIRHDRAIPDYVAGAIVRLVRINGSAARAGVRVGDVIQAVDDRLIQNVCGFDHAIASHACDDVRLTIRRGTSTIEIIARLTPTPKPGPHFDDQQACRNGVPSSCTALGKQHKAIDLFGLGCDLGDSEGCYLFAVNAGNNSSYARAAYRQACDDGNSLACTNLGWMLQFGHGGRVDLEEAVRLYRKGCQGSSCTGPNNLGCVNAARMLREGSGVEADQFEATRIVRQVCDRTPVNDEDGREIAHACSLAGTAFLVGEGAEKNLQLALPLLEKGCAANDTFGCYNLGTIYEGSDKPRALGYYQKACDRGDQEACASVSALRAR